MDTVKDTARKAEESVRAARTPSLSLASSRWGGRPTKPRLVTFSWGAVAPSTTRR